MIILYIRGQGNGQEAMVQKSKREVPKQAQHRPSVMKQSGVAFRKVARHRGTNFYFCFAMILSLILL